MAVLAPGDVVITPAVDRLSRDTTDLMVIARDMQRAGAGLRSLAETVLDTTGDFTELVLAMLGVADLGNTQPVRTAPAPQAKGQHHQDGRIVLPSNTSEDDSSRARSHRMVTAGGITWYLGSP